MSQYLVGFVNYSTCRAKAHLMDSTAAADSARYYCWSIEIDVPTSSLKKSQ